MLAATRIRPEGGSLTELAAIRERRLYRLHVLSGVYYLADVRDLLRSVGIVLSPKAMRQTVRRLEREGVLSSARRGFDGERQWTDNEVAVVADAVRRYHDGHGMT